MYSKAILLALAAALVEAKPPMGFANWSRFECNLNQTIFTETADAMKSNGMLEAGYDRINIDDCWPLHERAENGTLQWNPELFPDGMIWLGKYLKDRGFKFGIYSDVGNLTCGQYPGSWGYEKLDAETFASWGVDYLKLDGCNLPNPQHEDEAQHFVDMYHKWHEILHDMEHPMVFSESAPAYFCTANPLNDWFKVMDAMPSNGELARHSWDVANYKVGDHHWDSVMANYNAHTLLARYQTTSYSNDPDFLVADDPDLSLEERKSQFALWASFSAPLIVSAWIPELKQEDIDFLTNKDLIDVNQDDLSIQATLVSQDDTFDVLSKDLANGDRLLTVLNKGDDEQSLSVPLVRTGFTGTHCTYSVKELVSGKEFKLEDGKVETGNIPSHGTRVFRISPDSKGKACKDVIQTGQIFTAPQIKDNYCLTGDNEKVSVGKCNGKDEQVWQVTKFGTINNLVNTDSCLTDDGGEIKYANCKRAKNQKWSYNIHGNVVNKDTGNCLTMGKDNSTVSATDCGSNLYTQAFALPAQILL